MGAADADDDRHAGWEVEYLGRGQGDRPNTSAVRTDHPKARSYELQADRHESAPALVLFDEDDEPIAVYSALSWIACRRKTYPGESL